MNKKFFSRFQKIKNYTLKWLEKSQQSRSHVFKRLKNSARGIGFSIALGFAVGYPTAALSREKIPNINSIKQNIESENLLKTLNTPEQIQNDSIVQSILQETHYFLSRLAEFDYNSQSAFGQLTSVERQSIANNPPLNDFSFQNNVSFQRLTRSNFNGKKMFYLGGGSDDKYAADNYKFIQKVEEGRIEREQHATEFRVLGYYKALIAFSLLLIFAIVIFKYKDKISNIFQTHVLYMFECFKSTNRLETKTRETETDTSEITKKHENLVKFVQNLKTIIKTKDKRVAISSLQIKNLIEDLSVHQEIAKKLGGKAQGELLDEVVVHAVKQLSNIENFLDET